MRVITEELARAYVPDYGKADTLKGEVLRALCRILHRYWNDGDRIGIDYGNETCNAPARFLVKKVPETAPIIKAMWGEYSDNRYEELMNGLEGTIIDALRENPDKFSAHNPDDMWDWYDKKADDAWADDEDFEDEDDCEW